MKENEKEKKKNNDNYGDKYQLFRKSKKKI